MPIRLVFLCLGLMTAAAGCAKVKAAVCTDMVPAPKPPAASGKTPPDGKGAKPEEGKPEGDKESAETLTSGAHPEGPAQEQFALPFAWEKNPDEPLSKTRAYLREITRDNGAYMRRSAEFFKALASAESPRATVVSCADSRVQPSAFDLTPENDAFQVRNLANQIEPSMGSIQYGVEQLQTPLLVVLGHTGCTSIKAALLGTEKLSEPIRKELASIRPTKRKAKKIDDKFLAQLAVDNVNDQVERALNVFTQRVNSGQLTIIGAVFDMRDDFDKGAGKVTIVNVNGITEAGRLKAFHDAVLAGANLSSNGGGSPVKVDPFEKLTQMFEEHFNEHSGDEDEEDEDAPPSAEIIAPSMEPTPAPPPKPALVPAAPVQPPTAATAPAPAAPTGPAHGTEAKTVPAPHGKGAAPAQTVPAAKAKPAHH